MPLETQISNTKSRASLELWGGVECSVNRVGDFYFDQLEKNGHWRRIDDLGRIADLGIRTLRYPVLWEHVAPECLEERDWKWAGQRLKKLRELGMTPIVGLSHHGSGPRYTSLLDSSFPDKLAFYAACLARRFPWIEYYTPVNEPLTTARFSCLYGHWYPHQSDTQAFLTALINQCKGTALAMRAIRRVNPRAKLVQTEDLGFTQASPRLHPQAGFENARRWLTWDLLCGMVDSRHGLWQWLIENGVLERDLEWFQVNPCPPDILGINYYITSERYLDDDLSKYPDHMIGGNGAQRYADVETVRVETPKMLGIEAILHQAWNRYKIPIAVTEAHLGCSREEQCRWICHVWEGASRASGAGVDVRAVTAWSLFGSHDWNSLLTRNVGHYEPGAFDTRSGSVRPTALAKTIKLLATGTGQPQTGPGWWERPIRVSFPSKSDSPNYYDKLEKPILILGSNPIADAFARICELRGLPYRSLSHGECDLRSGDSVGDAIERHQAHGVVLTRPASDHCEHEDLSVPARVCSERGIPLLCVLPEPAFPACAQRFPRLPGELRPSIDQEAVFASDLGALIIRTGAPFGPWDEENFAVEVVKTIRSGGIFSAPADLHVSPSYVPEMVNVALDLWQDEQSGVWEVRTEPRITWADFARRVALGFELDSRRVVGTAVGGVQRVPDRPVGCVVHLGGLEDAVAAFCAESERSIVDALDPVLSNPATAL